MTRAGTAILTAAALTVALAACGSDSKATGNTTTTMASANTFLLTEWSVTPPSTPLNSGSVRITAKNGGGEAHELVIVRAKDAASLPLKSDGSVDEDKIPAADKVGELAELPMGKSDTKTFDLPAGQYVAFCNLVDEMGMSAGGMGSGMGHVHFQLGMVTAFTVG